MLMGNSICLSEYRKLPVDARQWMRHRELTPELLF